MRKPRSWLASIPSFGILSRRKGLRLWVQAIGGILLLNLLVGAAWTYPRWRAVEPKRQETQRIAEAGEVVRPALARARETYGCILRAEKDLEALRELIATGSGSTAEAVEEMRRIVDEVGLRVSQVTRQAEPIDELGLLELQTNLPVMGSYASVRELISALGSGGPFVAIDRIALSGPEESRTGGPLAVEFGLSTFVVESTTPLPVVNPGSPGNGARMNGDRADNNGHAATLDDPWVVVEEVRERLSSLPPLPVPPERYRVGLSRLQERPPSHDSVSRNLFAFEAVASPPSPRVEVPPPVDKPAKKPTPPPRVAYQLIGVLEMADGRRATLKQSDELYVVGVGDQLPDDIEVVSVGVDYVEVEVEGVRIRLTLENGMP